MFSKRFQELQAIRAAKFKEDYQKNMAEHRERAAAERAKREAEAKERNAFEKDYEAKYKNDPEALKEAAKQHGIEVGKLLAQEASERDLKEPTKASQIDAEESDKFRQKR
ncbi:MAG: hypothetical protein ACYCQI_09630 [Gammaproteobacteria bacterium]